MRHEKNPNDEFLLSLADVKHLLKKWKKSIYRGIFFGAAIGVSIALLRSVSFVSEATFYEKSKNGSSNSGTKSAALLLLGEEKENSAIVMLQSRKILESAAKKANLQATIEPYHFFPRSIVKAFGRLGNIKKNLETQIAYLTGSPIPAVRDWKPELMAQNLKYEDEVPLTLSLQFISEIDFNVSDCNGMIGSGRLYETFKTNKVQFVLTPQENAHLSGRDFTLYLEPSYKIVKELEEGLSIKADYKDKSFITLTLTYPNRQRSSEILNHIMDAYREHLINEHHQVVANQVSYLQERRKAMENELALLMQEHAEQLSTHGGGLDVLVATQQELQKNWLQIGLKREQMEQALKDGTYLEGYSYSLEDPSFVHQAIAEIKRCEQQCDAIDIRESSNQEFQGIDLETANVLYMAYCRELHEAEANIAQHQYIIEKLKNPQFELSSLATVLTDPISAEIVKKAGILALSIKDQSNRMQKELERLNQELDLQRNFLHSHLQQMVELSKLRANLLQDKIQALQGAIYQLLQKKIFLQEKGLANYVASRVSSFDQEKQLIQKQKQDLQEKFDRIPEQWAADAIVNLHLKIDRALMQNLGNLIESKNIADHLETSLSAPFDLAIPPIQPASPHIILFGLIGALLGGLSVGGYALTSTISEGIEATSDNLRLSGQSVAGKISEWTDNIETLRRLIAAVQPKVLLLLEGKGFPYECQLAALLNKREQKVLVIDGSFAQASSQDGLLQYLEGGVEQPFIQKEKGFDLLSSGGYTPYVAELLSSNTFQTLLSRFTSQYDWILITNRAPLISSEAEILSHLFDFVAITVTDEHLHELQRYFNHPHNVFLS